MRYRPVNRQQGPAPTRICRAAVLSLGLFLRPASLGPQSAAAVEPALAGRRPNVVIILADDLGFSDLGCYGGEIATPNLDGLAAGGLRFTQFYNTARCWPTRSSLMTGYYAQQIRMDPPQGRLPAWARLLPQRLKPLGYRCYHSGKWHVLGAPKPVADGGFDQSYWFEDWDRYFSPAKHFHNDQQLPRVEPESGYYATTAMADFAVRCLEEHAQEHAGDPFFLYLAFIAPHFPLHALPDDIARYRDRYREGWDSVRERRSRRLREMGMVGCEPAPLDRGLTPRYFKPEVLDQLGPGEIEHAVPWTELTEEQRAFQADKMAIHAAMVDRMDREIGRVLDQLRAMGAVDSTLVLFLSDNGADATLLVRGEGHDRAATPGAWASFLCLGPGWASASNAPFRRHKIWVSEGGIATPLIVHWPQAIRAGGGLRHDVGHVIDIVPTLLDLAEAAPAGSAGESTAPPLPGRSLVPALAGEPLPDRDCLFFSHEGNRSLRMGDWKLVSAQEDGDVWELFDLRRDRGERANLAGQQPERVRSMQTHWELLDEQFRHDAASP